MAETEKKKQGKISKWFRELKAETKKIVWPSWKQIKNNTIIVIIMLAIITLVIFAFDTGFGKIVGLVLSNDTTTSQSAQEGTTNTGDNDSTGTDTEGTTTNTDGTATNAEGDAAQANNSTDTQNAAN